MITETQNLIVDKIGITEDLYTELMYESGCLWLQRLQEKNLKYFKGEEQQVVNLLSSIQRNVLFWHWWVLEWQATDRSFLHSNDCSRHSYFMYKAETKHYMPHNVSLQLLRYAYRQGLSSDKAKKAGRNKKKYSDRTGTGVHGTEIQIPEHREQFDNGN